MEESPSLLKVLNYLKLRCILYGRQLRDGDSYLYCYWCRLGNSENMTYHLSNRQTQICEQM